MKKKSKPNFYLISILVLIFIFIFAGFYYFSNSKNFQGEIVWKKIYFYKQEIIFTNIVENEAATRQIEITNTGTTELTWQDPIIQNEFTLRNISPNPTPVGGISTTEVYFSSNTDGIYNETFELADACGRITELKALWQGS